ncbi:MAG: nucleoside triphosphate pyrophosphohydrolase [Actinomycetota bacterium]|nr:nucleoside triphosphate pyrophosphohydrolase [Actinomycetota bacterium]MDP3630095.1 nucleoside triphosphate pyrophosphohydrolase [Actinomycetota bacterium]
MGSIAIVGLEQDAGGALDERAAARLAKAAYRVVANGDGEAAEAVRRLGMSVSTYADLGLPPDAPSDSIVQALLDLAVEGDVALAAFGYPFLRTGVISGLLSRAAGSLDMFPVSSPLQVLVLALDIDLTADVDIVDASSLAGVTFHRDTHLIVTGIDNALVARAVGKRLRENYAAEHSVVTAGCLESGGFDLQLATVADLDDAAVTCRDTAVFVAPSRIAPPGGFDELVRLIGVLRAPGGCPWDREQTHESLGKHMVEEAYEAVHAIEQGDLNDLADELGDVLLQVVLHAQIGAEESAFTVDDVIAGIIAKIRRRHPHIFGSATAETSADVLRNWDEIKRGERAGKVARGGDDAEDGERPPAPGVLAGITPTLPALMYAQKMSRRAAAAGFEWENIDGVWDKVAEEIEELKATTAGSPEAADEVGDVLFTIVNVARHLGIDSEDALRGTCAKFGRRFEDMESQAAAQGIDVRGLSLDEYERLWRTAKDNEAATRGPDRD